MYRGVCLTAMAALLFVGCGRRDNKATSSTEDDSREARETNQQACPRRVPDVEDVVFIDAETVLVFPGYLAGIADEEVFNRDRAPLVSRDGGESWNRLGFHPLEFDSISFSTASRGWLVKQSSQLWTTTDGGYSWSFVSKIEDDGESLDYSVQAKFEDDLNGWVLGLNSLWRTEDGGRTWSGHGFSSLVSSFFSRGEDVWVASQYRSEQNNAIYETHDSGMNWAEVEMPNTAPGLFDSVDIKDLFFVDEKTGWLADNRGVYRTEDRGVTWTRQRLPRRKLDITSLCFVNQLEGWCAGYKVWNAAENDFEAILLHTSDGGGTWRQVEVGAKQLSFDKVYFGDAQNGWLVASESGEVEDLASQSANIYRTRDGGSTWKKVLRVKSPYSSN